MSFGSHIRKLRTDVDLSQTEVADFVGIPQSYLSALERGKKTNPSKEVVHRLARLYEVPYEQLASLVWADEADELKPELPGTVDLPPVLRRLAARLGEYLNDRDWEQVSAYAEGLAAARRDRAQTRAAQLAEEHAAYGMHVAEPEEGAEEQPGKKAG